MINGVVFLGDDSPNVLVLYAINKKAFFCRRASKSSCLS